MSWFFLRQSNVAQRDDFPKIVLKESRGLPIPRPDSQNVQSKTVYDCLARLVQRMLEMQKKKDSGTLAPSQLERLNREITATDAEIDDLVYRLYGITDEERTIIETQR